VQHRSGADREDTPARCLATAAVRICGRGRKRRLRLYDEVEPGPPSPRCDFGGTPALACAWRFWSKETCRAEA